MSRGMGVLSAVAAVVLAALPASLAAQRGDRGGDWDGYEREDWGPPRTELLLSLNLARPVGEFQSFVDLGGGGGIGLLLHLNDERNVALRVDGTFVVYGSDSFRAPLSPTIPFVDVDVTTTNFIASMGVGPQIFLGHGGLRPYVFGTAGFSYFATQTSVSGSNDSESFASTTNFDDMTLALSGGAGLAIQLSHGEHPVSLDLSASYQRNGLTEYLTEGDLYETPGGGWAVDPVLSETNLMSYRVGVSIGLR